MREIEKIVGRPTVSYCKCCDVVIAKEERTCLLAVHRPGFKAERNRTAMAQCTHVQYLLLY